jgi:hypothetical protein
VAAGVHGDRALNRRQARRLRRLSEYLERSARLFMFELLVPAERAELEELGGSQAAYDRARRPEHMVDALIDLQDAGVEPDVWKIEGLDRREDCEAIVVAARRAGRARRLARPAIDPGGRRRGDRPALSAMARRLRKRPARSIIGPPLTPFLKETHR